MSQKDCYLRVRIAGQMQVCTELHVGDGEQIPMSQRSPQSPKAEGNFQATCTDNSQKPYFQTTCTDNNHKPYIPGSSLRGALRSWTNGNVSSTHQIKLFGPATGQQDSAAQAGQLRVANMEFAACANGGTQDRIGLPCWDNTRNTIIRHHTAIDAVTRTAKAHQLFQYEMVPVGTVFNVTLELHGTLDAWVHEDSIKQLLNILVTWDGEHTDARLGQGSSLDLGRMRWLMDKQQVEVVTQEGMCHWLNEDPASHTTLPWQAREFSSTQVQRTSDRQIRLYLDPLSPYLSNQSDALVAEDRDLSATRLRFARDTFGRPMLPASSLKGWLRAYAHKIIATIAHQHFGVNDIAAHKTMQCLTNRLFGNQLQKSHIRISAAHASTTITHEQTFSAIDRFTGGVSHIKGQPSLYTVQASLSPLVATLHLDQCLLSVENKAHWWGLLLLILRDVLADGLWLGWGQAKGYGQFNATIEWTDTAGQAKAIASFQDLTGSVAQEDGSAWITALHAYIHAYLKEQLSTTTEVQHVG